MAYPTPNSWLICSYSLATRGWIITVLFMMKSAKKSVSCAHSKTSNKSNHYHLNARTSWLQVQRNVKSTAENKYLLYELSKNR